MLFALPDAKPPAHNMCYKICLLPNVFPTHHPPFVTETQVHSRFRCIYLALFSRRLVRPLRRSKLKEGKTSLAILVAAIESQRLFFSSMSAQRLAKRQPESGMSGTYISICSARIDSPSAAIQFISCYKGTPHNSNQQYSGGDM